MYFELENNPLAARKMIYKLVRTRKEGQEDKVAFINNKNGAL